MHKKRLLSSTVALTLIFGVGVSSFSFALDKNTILTQSQSGDILENPQSSNTLQQTTNDWGIIDHYKDNSYEAQVTYFDNEKIEGTGVSGASIVVSNYSNNVICSDTVKTDNTWNCVYKEFLPTDTLIKIVQTEIGKIPSRKSELYIPAKGKSDTPKVTTITRSHVEGTGVPGAVVVLNDSIDNTIYCNLHVPATGKWTCYFGVKAERGSTINVLQVEEKSGGSDILKIVVPEKDLLMKERFEGVNRYATSASLNKTNSNNGGPLFIVTGESFPDALVSSPAVSILNGKLILTNSKKLSKESIESIKKTQSNKIYIIGGKNSISENVVNEIKKLVPQKTIFERIDGKNRYDTSQKIYNKFFASSINYESHIYIATGRNWPDALTASAIAGSTKEPVLLINDKDQNHPYQLVEQIRKSGYPKAILVGGEGSIGKNIFESFKVYLTPEYISRIGGKDRYETSVLLNKKLDERNNEIYDWVPEIGKVFAPDTTNIWLATGANFPDALVSSVYASQTGHRLYLSSINCLDKNTHEAIYNKKSEVIKLNIVGGQKSITEKALTTIC